MALLGRRRGAARARPAGRSATTPPATTTIRWPASAGTRPRPTRRGPARRCRRSSTGTASRSPSPARQIMPLANLGGPRPVPVGTTRSVNRYGVHDLAGNVREWCCNPIDRPGEHFILGGGWNDPGYAFNDAYAQPAFDRSPTNGFRCMRVARRAQRGRPDAARSRSPFRDFRAEQPVPTRSSPYFRRQFDYDRTPLHAVGRRARRSPGGRLRRRSASTRPTAASACAAPVPAGPRPAALPDGRRLPGLPRDPQPRVQPRTSPGASDFLLKAAARCCCPSTRAPTSAATS